MTLPDLGVWPVEWISPPGAWEAWEPSSTGSGPPTTLRCHTPKAGTWQHQPLEPPGAVVTPAVTRAVSQETPGVMEFWGGSRVCTSYLLQMLG